MNPTLPENQESPKMQKMFFLENLPYKKGEKIEIIKMVYANSIHFRIDFVKKRLEITNLFLHNFNLIF